MYILFFVGQTVTLFYLLSFIFSSLLNCLPRNGHLTSQSTTSYFCILSNNSPPPFQVCRTAGRALARARGRDGSGLTELASGGEADGGGRSVSVDSDRINVFFVSNLLAQHHTRLLLPALTIPTLYHNNHNSSSANGATREGGDNTTEDNDHYEYNSYQAGGCAP